MPYENELIQFTQQNMNKGVEGARSMTSQVLSFAQNYIDQGIDFARELAPKVWEYLQIKCYVSGTMAIVGLIVAIILGIVAYSLTPGYIKKEKKYNKKFKFDTENGSHGGRLVLSFVMCLISVAMIIGFFVTIDKTILAFTDVCPIDTAISILKDAGTKMVNR